MLAVIKAIGILFLEVVVFYILGTLLLQVVLKQVEARISKRIIAGFLLLQIFFQICALPFIYLDTSLTLLTKAWSGVITIIVFVSVILNRKYFLRDLKKIIEYLSGKKFFVVIAGLGILAMCYYVSINGEHNEDAEYYIGLINTTLTMDSMYRFNVYNGYGMESLYLRRALVTFDIHSAVLCKLFSIHPLILTRITRASLNVILTAFATYLVGLKLFRKNETPVAEKKSHVLVTLSFGMMFLFVGNIYTNARFLLTRAYEGKAFAANVLVLFMIYLCLDIITNKQKSDYLILMMGLWASIAISSSAIIVNIIAVVILLGAYIILQLLNKNKVKKNDKC